MKSSLSGARRMGRTSTGLIWSGRMSVGGACAVPSREPNERPKRNRARRLGPERNRSKPNSNSTLWTLIKGLNCVQQREVYNKFKVLVMWKVCENKRSSKYEVAMWDVRCEIVVRECVRANKQQFLMKCSDQDG